MSRPQRIVGAGAVWSGVGTLAVALVANAYDLEYTIIDQWSGVGTLAVALVAKDEARIRWLAVALVRSTFEKSRHYSLLS
jgi:methylthioribose-1-phosphate isomerase